MTADGVTSRSATRQDSQSRIGIDLTFSAPKSVSLQASKTVILCEALIDALSFWCAGYRYVTASYGVEGFTSPSPA